MASGANLAPDWACPRASNDGIARTIDATHQNRLMVASRSPRWNPKRLSIFRSDEFLQTSPVARTEGALANGVGKGGEVALTPSPNAVCDRNQRGIADPRIADSGCPNHPKLVIRNPQSGIRNLQRCAPRGKGSLPEEESQNRTGSRVRGRRGTASAGEPSPTNRMTTKEGRCRSARHDLTPRPNPIDKPFRLSSD